MDEMRLIDGARLERGIKMLNFYSEKDKQFIIELVRSYPTIEAEPIRHGRWENPIESKPRMFERNGHTFTQRQCSECKLWSIQVTGSITYKYCPHCRAKIGE